MKRLILLCGLFLGCIPKPTPPLAPMDIYLDSNGPKTEFKQVIIIPNYRWEIAATTSKILTEVISDNEILYRSAPDFFSSEDERKVKVIAKSVKGGLIISSFLKEKKELMTMAVCFEGNSVYEYSYNGLSFIITCSEAAADIIENMDTNLE